ncbi:hypothetical protein SteCoe_1464 [Stentor coeruleus]|uniref:Uncharacterized protein n=1 Tax=Stentor coeruleus TaxID=5963 RepID=A0A1R2D1V0_9CILI|nr:hypothetical protein SteCoe_1464 [Stentor coeruleus]
MKGLVYVLIIVCIWAEDFEIILQELDHVTITEDAEDNPLLAFTSEDFDDQPTRIFNNVGDITYLTLTVEEKTYLFSKPEVIDDILDDFDEDEEDELVVY